MYVKSPVHCINKQHNILMRTSYTNRVSHFLASQNKPFGSLGIKLWEGNIYIWVFSFESSIKFLQVTRTFASSSFCSCTSLLTLTKSFFSSIYLLKLSSSKTFITRWRVSVMIAFSFFQEHVLIIFHLLFWFHVKFKQGIQGF